ncbi:MAG: YeeE/YedE family protein [Ignavibacteriales bacterium]|nr:YeeE/YedE family protein [Ignavibacteriales bacterium]
MTAPFYRYGLFGDDTSLVFAFVIGLGFGFFLERAGFGSATKLASQFYGRDLTVFKVMFTAIVTAMLGLFWLGWLGVLDLSRVLVLPTYFTPQLIGGLIFGVGFVSGGYCPGTCAVAAVTGKMDGWVHLAGMLAGIFIFGELFPLLANFYSSDPMGAATLDQVLHVPYGVTVFLVVVLALAGFLAAERIEKKLQAVH